MSNRFRNTNWDLADANGNVGTWERVAIAVLMDIREELQNLNAVLRCPNFQDMPRKLDRIVSNTKRPRRKASTR